MRFMVGIDVGGTFTDFVAYDRETSEIEVWKDLSTPGDPVDGILDGLARYRDRGDDRPTAARHHGRHQRHPGAQGRGGRLCHDQGLPRRALHPARQPQVPLRHELGQAEAAGEAPPLLRARRAASTPTATSSTPLDEAEVRARGAPRSRPMPRDRGGRRLPAVLLPQPGARAAGEGDPRRGAAASMPVSISYDVLPKWKEYERASTTIADAYLKPIVSRAAARHARAAATRPASTAHAVVIKSNGGEMTLEAAADAPIQMAGLRPDRRRDRQPARGRAARHRPAGHPRHGRHLDRLSRPSSTARRASPPPSRSNGACRSRCR